MLRPETDPLPARARDQGPGTLALGISLGLHGAALACFALFREVNPPEPYTVIAVELVHAADVMGSPGEETRDQSYLSQGIDRASAEAAGSRHHSGKVTDSGTPDEGLAAFEVPSESDGSPVEREGEPTQISGPVPTPRNTSDRHETVPSTPTEPKLTTENSSVPEAPTETMRPVPPVPRRKPLTANPSTGPKSAKTRIEENLTEMNYRTFRLADKKAAREVTQSDADRAAAQQQRAAKLKTGKDQGVAALPATGRANGLMESLADSAGTPARYAGHGLSSAPPRYPFLARRRGQEGRVVLRVKVTAGGDAAAVSVWRSSGHRLLDDAAVEAVKTWRFVPASRGGIPVAGSVDVPVSFKLTD